MDANHKAIAMFAEGKKINQVAVACFNKNWLKAKKLHTEWKGDGGGQTTSALDLAKPGILSDDSDSWDLVITVPTAQMNAIIGTFSPCEKATAIQNVLQSRFDATLGIEA